MRCANMAISGKEGLTVLERAFELAKTGGFAGPEEITRQLKVEGYAVSQITGPALLKQLRTVCRKARAEQEAAKPEG